MWRLLVNDHDIRIPRDMVLQMMREIDPEGVRQRKAHRLVRHRNYAQGPNYVWHVDGYDKLKPYGFCFNGAIIDVTAGGFYGSKYQTPITHQVLLQSTT